MKKNLLLLCAVILFQIPLFAQTVSIGTANDITYTLFNMQDPYTRHASLYTSSEIGTTGTISTIGWNINKVWSNGDGPVKIYLKEYAGSSMNADSWANMISGATLVYDGNATFPVVTNEWVTFTLTTPFNYASNNLMVLVEANYGGSGNGRSGGDVDFNVSTGMTGKAQFWWGNPVAATGTISAKRPMLQLTFGVSSSVDAGISAITTPTTGSLVGSQNVQATIKNWGSTTLTAATIGWSINGVAQTPYSWTGSLTQNTTASATLGSYNFSTPGSYTIKAWTSSPNSTTDEYNANDTTTATVQITNGVDASLSSITDPYGTIQTGTTDIIVYVRNKGTSNLASATIAWTVNGTAQAPYSWTGDLAQNEFSNSFTLGSYNFATQGDYTIKAWTEIPNGTLDSDHSNDTATRVITVEQAQTFALDAGISAINNPIGVTAAGVKDISVTIKNYGTDDLTSATIAWSVDGIAQPSYSWTGTLAQDETDGPITLGSFNFDTEGYYDILVWTEDPNDGADEYTDNDAKSLSTYCITEEGVNENNANANSFTLFPNPACQSFTYAVEGIEDATIAIYTIQGKEVYTEKMNHTSNGTIDISFLSKGSYVVKIVSEKVSLVNNLIIQ